MSIVYKVKTASQKQISSHLQCCSDSYTQPLTKRVNIEEYSQKIFDKATTFEAWHDDVLVGLVAVYFNDPSGTSTGYITDVSVNSNFIKKGIATSLMNKCFKHAKEQGIKHIALEVDSNDSLAINFYNKFGFKETEKRGNSTFMSR